MECERFAIFDDEDPDWVLPVIICAGVLGLIICIVGFYTLFKNISPWEEEASAINKIE